MEPNDATLLMQWKGGDSLAARMVVERYAGTLGAVAYALLRDASLAEETVQETFARASANLDKSNGVQKLGPWLVGIARHVAVDTMRKRRREVPFAGQEVHARSSPVGEACRHELQACLTKALDALPDDQRELFTMKYMAGLTYADIGRALGMSTEAVGQKLWRIRRRLQDALKEHQP